MALVMTDARNVLAPKQFNEAFTLYLNTEGRPVERRLRDMTPGEVLAAVDWHDTEANRAERDSEPFVEMTATMKAGTLNPDTTSEQINHAVESLRNAADLLAKAARLSALVHSNIPQWRRHPEVSFSDAVSRWWPGGRAPRQAA